MTEKEKKAEIVRYWWDMAQESLEAAQRELAAASYNFAMNRVYYALFYREQSSSRGTDSVSSFNRSHTAFQ